MVPTSLEPEQLLTTKVQEIVSFCKTKSLIEVKRKKFLVGCLKPIVVLFQIKVFMVSNCCVGPNKDPVVAVALKDIESALSYSISEIKTTLEKVGGGTASSHLFLKEGSDTSHIIKASMERKRRCFAFFRSRLPAEEKRHLIGCMFILVSLYCCIITIILLQSVYPRQV